MSKDSKIGWTHHTFNGWWGCENVSPECDHCYAEAFAKRTGHDIWGKSGRRFFGDKHWAEPLKWDRAAAAAGERHRVFCSSMSDVFEKRLDLVEPRARLFRLIKATPNIDWLLLTKRPQFMPAMIPWCIDGTAPWPNVWLGTTCGIESSLWRVEALMKVPAAVRFVSAEPLLGPVDLSAFLPDPFLKTRTTSTWGHAPGLDWVIIGGESGAGHRPMEVKWAEDLAAQAAARGVKVFVKQDSGPRPGQQGRLSDQLVQIRQFPRVSP